MATYDIDEATFDGNTYILHDADCVPVTYTTSDWVSFSCTHTYTEIQDALAAGKNVQFFLNGGGYIQDFHLNWSTTDTYDIILENWSPENYSTSYDDLAIITHATDDTITYTVKSSVLQTAVRSAGGGGATTTWYGTCSTTGSTAQKDVTCAGYTLTAGAVIGVLFSTANTAATPTLNVNSTTAKAIYVGNATLNSTTNVLKWSANTFVVFMYDGTYYRYITSASGASLNSTDGGGTWYGTSSTTATTAAKTTSITNFRLTPGAMVCIYFSTANTKADAALSLNVNSTGAKTIRVNGTATSSSVHLLWPAKTSLTFCYTGTYWDLVARADFQEKLVSGANIKTINNSNILGSGNLTVLAQPDILIATSTAADTSMTAGTMHQVVLDDEDGLPVSMAVTNDGGVGIGENGYYMVSGQIYFSGTSAVTGKGVYVFVGADFATATEQFGVLIPKPTGSTSGGAIPFGPKLMPLNAGDNVYMCARCVSGTGTLYNSNASTFLLVEKK